ncbi:MAG: type II secretion system protein [Patescibacteria group bacterium]
MKNGFAPYETKARCEPSRFRSGFTLIEMLVSIFIIGVLSAALLLNYRSGQNEAFLTRAAAVFETDLRGAQNLAISSRESNGLVPCGYGLHYVDNRRYSIYAGQRSGASSCQTSNQNYQSGLDSVYEENQIIESAVIFKTSWPDIFFEPPDPSVYINKIKLVGTSATIQFCLENDLTKCRNLTVDTAGRIATQ